MNRRRKKSHFNLVNVGIIIALIIAITVVIVLIFGSDKKPSGPTLSNGASNTTSGGDNSSGLSEGSDTLSALPTPLQPSPQAEFWGDNINLNEAITKVEVPGKYPKWPSQPGFPVPEADFTLFKNNASSSKPLTGAIIILDPGHGGEDLGAVYPRHPIKPEIIESKINLDVALSLRELLEDAGAEVILTRETDYFYRLYYRSAIVAKHILEDFYGKLSANSGNRNIIQGYINEMDKTLERNSDEDKVDIFYPKGVNRQIKNILDIQGGYSNAIFISLHCNSSDTPNSLKGTRVYYATSSAVYNLQAPLSKDVVEPEYQNFNDDLRLKLAQGIYNSITSAFPDMAFHKEDQAVLTMDYAVIRETNLVSALVEMGYVNHDYDREILLNTDKQRQFAESIYEAIYNYYCK